MTTKHMLITKLGHDDYSVWLTDNLEEQDSGYSERGSKNEIKTTVDEYMLSDERHSNENPSSDDEPMLCNISDELKQSLVTNITKALLPAISAESIDNKETLLWYSDPRDVMTVVENEEYEEFDFAMSVRMTQAFEPIEGFKPHGVDLFFVLTFSDCEYDRATGGYIRNKESTWKALHSSWNGNNLHWHGGGDKEQGSSKLGLSVYDDYFIHDTVMKNILSQATPEAIEAFTSKVFEVGNQILKDENAG